MRCKAVEGRKSLNRIESHGSGSLLEPSNFSIYYVASSSLLSRYFETKHRSGRPVDVRIDNEGVTTKGRLVYIRRGRHYETAASSTVDESVRESVVTSAGLQERSRRELVPNRPRSDGVSRVRQHATELMTDVYSATFLNAMIAIHEQLRASQINIYIYNYVQSSFKLYSRLLNICQ